MFFFYFFVYVNIVNRQACIISYLFSITFIIMYITTLSFHLLRFTKDTPRFKDDLDIMKFLCQDFWNTVFKKQVDNLRTNHQVSIF